MRYPLSATTALATLLLVAGFPALLPASAARATDPEALLRGGRVVLVPPNLGVRAVAEVEPGVDPVWRELLAHFADQPTRASALERSSAAALWNEVMRDVQAQPGAGVYDAYAIFARRIADQVDYSAIVFPSLVTRAARVNGTSATWDGVRRKIDGPLVREMVGASTGSDLLVYRDGVRGQLAAASLHVAVLSPDGELRFEGAGGLALLQELAPTEATDVSVAMRSDAFDDAKELREGIEAAFRTPLPASSAH